MSGTIRLTVLGSGTSMGVPTLGCHCAVCESTDPRDKRLRPSLLLSHGRQNVVIDTTPDFRAQALRAGLDRLDGVLLTHCHADHILGFDDLRPYNYRQKAAIPVYGTEETFRVVRRVFAYVFDDKPTLSSLPSVDLRVVDGPFSLAGIPFVPVPLLHGEMDVLGFRFGRAAYMTDFSQLPESSVVLLEDLHDLILDALRDVPHPMHQTVEQALALIDRLKPKRAWFTHIAHDLGHEATNERLRKAGYGNVQLAWDGLTFEVGIEEVVGDQRRVANGDRKRPATGNQRPVRGQIVVFASAEEWAAAYGQQSVEEHEKNHRRDTEYAEKAQRREEQPAKTEGGILAANKVGAKLDQKERSRSVAALGITSDSSTATQSGRGSVVAIGTFDGIHVGHQEVLRFAIVRAKECGAVATALTFEPPPVKVLRPDVAPPRISTNQQRLDWFGILGMEAAVVLPFTKQLAALTADEFVEEILVRQLQVRSVVVGENFKFGRGQTGNVGVLRELGMQLGFEVVVHTPVMLDGEVVSSTLVRKSVAVGDVRRAAKLLGRPFALTGEVVSGTGTGKKLLFATLNLKPDQELLPARGVYITRTVLDGEMSSRRSVTNVGVRPTFNGAGLSVETHLLDYAGNLAPKNIEVRFWKRLRDEKKFAGVEELKAQIERDIATAQRFFGKLRAARGREKVSSE